MRLGEHLTPVIGLMQQVTVELLWGKPCADWEFVRNVIRPTFGASLACLLLVVCCPASWALMASVLLATLLQPPQFVDQCGFCP